MFSPQIRHHRLKLLFSFMLGVALTAVLFTSTQLHSRRCAGDTCVNPWPRLRKFVPETSTIISTFLEGTNSPSALSASTEQRLYISSQPAPLTSKSLASRSPSFKSTPRTINPPSSTFSIPTMRHVARTFHVPSVATYSESMVSRTSKQACTQTEYCEGYLSQEEKAQFSQCSNKCIKSDRKYGPEVKGACHFMNGRGRLPVVLASFPGSGNTWARGLLEKVTGVCTGVSCGQRHTYTPLIKYMCSHL